MKVLLTGSRGVIGSVLKNNLEHQITEFDLPDFDARNYDQLLKEARGHDAIVHLAWETKTDNFASDHINPENILIALNVYKAAVEAGVGRIVIASSVHADKFTDGQIGGLLDPYSLPIPDSPYGASKVMVEALGRYYANTRGIGVVCIRFGGVNPENVPPSRPESERQIWLSHRDCTQLVTACLEASTIPNNFEIVYGVSNNAGRVHDISNSIGWQPVDGAR